MNRAIQIFTRRINFIPYLRYQGAKEMKMRDSKTGYYMDPEEVARRMIKVIALHDDVKNPENITLQSTWHEIGLNDMTYVEVMIEVEREFEIELPDENIERFRNLNDAVEFLARSFFTV